MKHLKTYIQLNEMRSRHEVSKDPVVMDGVEIDPDNIVRFKFEANPSHTEEHLRDRVADYGKVFSYTNERAQIHEVIVVLDDAERHSAFIQQMKAYYPGFGATDFR